MLDMVLPMVLSDRFSGMTVKKVAEVVLLWRLYTMVGGGGWRCAVVPLSKIFSFFYLFLFFIKFED